MVYLDTSVIVAYYFPEPLSSRVQQMFATEAGLAISELVEVEFVSALSRRVRIGDILRADAERGVRLFQEHLSFGLYGRESLDLNHYRLAHRFIMPFELPLKAPDALHLAVASMAGRRLVTADQQLASNAEHLHIPVELISA